MRPPNCVFHQTNVIKEDKKQAKANTTASPFFFSLILFLFFLFDANCLTKNSQSLIHISWAAGFLKVGTVSSAHSYKCRSAPPVGMESQISGSKNLKM